MKNKENTIAYDGSFNGFLSAVFQVFEQKIQVNDIISNQNIQGGLFSDIIRVSTNDIQARRVWYAVQKENHSAIKNIYFAFLSESTGIEFLLYKYIRLIMLNDSTSSTYCSEEVILKINQLAGLVGREKKRMEAEVELQSIYPDLKLAYIEPNFNVLPLLSRFVRSCYRDSDWILFDLKRKYGIYCHDNKLQIVSSSFISNNLAQKYLVEGGKEIISMDHALENYNRETYQNPSFKRDKNPTAA